MVMSGQLLRRAPATTGASSRQRQVHASTGRNRQVWYICGSNESQLLARSTATVVVMSIAVMGLVVESEQSSVVWLVWSAS